MSYFIMQPVIRAVSHTALFEQGKLPAYLRLPTKPSLVIKILLVIKIFFQGKTEWQ